MINTIGEEQRGVAVEIAPTENFGFDRFVAEANEENSTWDSYGGVTPFLEMIALVNTGTIEPWDEYLPEGMIDDFVPAVRRGIPLGRQVLRLAAAARYHRAGAQRGSRRKSRARSNGGSQDLGRVHRERAKVQESGVAPYGLVFDYRDWRSLIPITHSISLDVYTPDWPVHVGQRARDPGSRNPGANDGADNPRRSRAGRTASALLLADEAAFTGQQAAYSFKYQNSPLRYASQWPDPQADAFQAPRAPEGGRGRDGLLGHWRRPVQVWQEQGAGRRLLHWPSRPTSGSGRIVVGDPAEEICRWVSCRSTGVGMDGVEGQSDRVDNGQSRGLDQGRAWPAPAQSRRRFSGSSAVRHGATELYTPISGEVTDAKRG